MAGTIYILVIKIMLLYSLYNSLVYKVLDYFSTLYASGHCLKEVNSLLQVLFLPQRQGAVIVDTHPKHLFKVFLREMSLHKNAKSRPKIFTEVLCALTNRAVWIAIVASKQNRLHLHGTHPFAL